MTPLVYRLRPSAGVVHLHEISGKKEFESFLNEEQIRCYTLKENGNDEVFEDFRKLSAALNFDIKKAFMRHEEFVKILMKVSLSLQ